MPKLRSPHLRFAAILGLYGAAVMLTYRDEVLGETLAPLALITTRITAFLVRSMGMDALREGPVLLHPGGFSYEVAYTCTGFLPIVTWMVCILAYPQAMRNKVIGVALGTAVLLSLNFVRLTSLFYLGVHFPDSFVLAHEVVWEGIWVIFFIGLWLGWIHWSGVREANPTESMFPRRNGADALPK